MPKTARNELWDFLMNCLRIHHQVKDRKIRTIPEAQDQALTVIKKSVMEQIPKKAITDSIEGLSNWGKGRNDTIDEITQRLKKLFT